MIFEQTKRQMTVRSSLLLFLIVAVATIITPFLITQDLVFTYLGIFNAFASGAIWQYLTHSPSKPWHPYLVIVAAFFILVPYILISGGANSEFAIVLPVFPLIICLLANARTAWWFTGFICLLMILLLLFGNYLPDLTMEQVSADKTTSRTLWLCLTCGLTAVFGAEFERVSLHLGSKLNEQSDLDPLTNVLNRRSILRHLEMSVSESQVDSKWLTLVMVDIDHFRSINERYGHELGDNCLQYVAGKLLHITRDGKDSVGRYSTGKFMIVMEGVDQSRAHHIIDNIRIAIAEPPIDLMDTNIDVTVSIGYCCLPGEHIHSSTHLLNEAEAALSAAIRSGYNCVVGAEEAQLIQSRITS